MCPSPSFCGRVKGDVLYEQGGYLDSWGIPLVTTQLLDSCDFLLSVGAKDETEEIALLKQKGPKSIVLAGTDRTGPLANKEKQLLYLSGNLKTILKELLNKVRRDDDKKVSIRKSVNDLRDFRAKLESKARSLAAEEPIHPAYVACQLAQLFDQETVFTVDSTDSFRWLSLMLPVKGIPIPDPPTLSFRLVKEFDGSSDVYNWWDQFLPPSISQQLLDLSQPLLASEITPLEFAEKMEKATTDHLAREAE